MRMYVAVVLLLVALAAAAPRDEVSSEEVEYRKTTTKKPTTTAKTTKPTTTTTTTTTEKPDVTKPPTFRGDYERMGDFGYYKIYNTYSSWWNAWQTCFKEGSHLLILRSQEEYNALQAWKPDYQVPGYSWYGAHHKFRSQEFVTLFDEPLADTGYYKWSRDFTTNRTLYNNEDYPEIIVNLHPAAGITEGLLLVYKQSSYYFVCKMEI